MISFLYARRINVAIARIGQGHPKEVVFGGLHDARDYVPFIQRLYKAGVDFAPVSGPQSSVQAIRQAMEHIRDPANAKWQQKVAVLEKDITKLGKQITSAKDSSFGLVSIEPVLPISLNRYFQGHEFPESLEPHQARAFDYDYLNNIDLPKLVSPESQRLYDAADIGGLAVGIVIVSK